MAILESALVLLICAVALGWLARRLDFPYPIALVMGGGAMGFMPALPQLPFNPDLVLYIVLPPVLHQAAVMMSWRDLKAEAGPIGLLSVGLVLVTTLAVGAALKLMIPELPWGAALVFGAIVSPPDAVAATAILSRLNIPRRVVNILEGESLVNDASALVLYKFALAALAIPSFSFTHAATQFLGVALGGMIIGLAVARVSIALHRHLGDVLIQVLTSLLVPYVAYILAESLHASGVLAVVAAGLLRGRHSPVIASGEMRLVGRAIESMQVFLVNTLVFAMIGLQLSGIVKRLEGYSAFELVSAGALLSAVAIAIRFAWVYAAFYFPSLLWSWRGRKAARPEAEYFIIGWCGMRGIVSLAAALALPITLEDGSPFPYRDPIIFFTFIVISVTLVLQGLTLPRLIRKLRVGTDWSVQDERANARRAMSEAALKSIDELARRENAPPELAGRIGAEFAEKVAASHPDAPMSEQEAGLAQRLRQAALTAERTELIRIWQENQISDDVLHEYEEVLDHQEAHL